MMSQDITIRKANARDASDIAILFKTTRRNNLPYLPVLHTAEEDLAYFAEVIKNEAVTVAQSGTKVVGFCAYKNNWLNHLYVIPDHQGVGVGTALLSYAKTNNSELNLWVFQRNVKAIEFYRRNGFELVRLTDGSANEEQEPDAQYVWRQTHLLLK